ncbi:MAG: RloB domain-containing protein [Lachnospiraceae bacterium]|nr:RloB domain-containing protein [Lachnospiraceae bacterium]
MSRKIRQPEKTLKVFCEGETEFNYFEYIRKNKKVSLTIRPVDMKGGGYGSFLQMLQEDANSNCMAKIIVVDGDRALSVPGEEIKLKQLAEFCKVQNSSKRTPHILIVNYPDFEYVACLHRDTYKGQDALIYIKKVLGYQDVEDFKADADVFRVLTAKGGSIEKLRNSTNPNTKIVENRMKYNKTEYELNVKSKFLWERLGIRGTNFDDFYEVLDIIGA